MKYTYNDMPDKSIEGIKKEVTEGLVKIGVYFYQTLGFPSEMFIDKIKDMSFPEQVLFYMEKRNKYPNIFNK